MVHSPCMGFGPASPFTATQRDRSHEIVICGRSPRARRFCVTGPLYSSRRCAKGFALGVFVRLSSGRRTAFFFYPAFSTIAATNAPGLAVAHRVFGSHGSHVWARSHV